ncbi:hypothetical protein CCHR01_06491 [Colletotrichum chrysophilum]|uniref:Uncharacterized protein n=1 Tax=Colletotrichum chrysophilum TaxID=1836956 RepID=A0AAD9ASB3_9PEZI|nr:hypothetical protein CCHR01_06491 [Colletotrichum chrysophilum]
MACTQVSTNVARVEGDIINDTNASETDNHEIHTNLISSSQLLKILEDRLPKDSFTIEMRHSIYIVRVKKSGMAKAQALFKEFASGIPDDKSCKTSDSIPNIADSNS